MWVKVKLSRLEGLKSAAGIHQETLRQISKHLGKSGLHAWSVVCDFKHKHDALLAENERLKEELNRRDADCPTCGWMGKEEGR